ncbi:GAP family protein [Streptomyces sp. NPDC090022]|uniref:GAP family protein n=1 Tax=Streptomyces sp. NPDC090022 TaxID=3365920 RepID=UPI00382FF90C
MLLDLLLIGAAITLYPVPGMAFVLVVSAPRGVYNGLAFIIAWLACLVAVIAMVLLFTGGQSPAPHSPPSLAATLLIGLSLISASACWPPPACRPWSCTWCSRPGRPGPD